MAFPIRLDFMKDSLGAPDGQEDVIEPLPCHRSETTVLSAWRLTPEERLNVVMTGVVLLHVMGHTHAPVAVGVMAPEKKSDAGT